MDEPTYKQLGFTLDTANVARMLRLTIAEVLDLVRAHDINFYVTTVRGGVMALRYHEIDVSAYRRREHMASVIERAQVQKILREYLATVEPVEDFDRALATGAPLLGATRGGRTTLNVKVESVQSWYQKVQAESPEQDQRRLLATAVTDALTHLDAMRVRGVVPVADRGGDGKQRWAGIWWRIPPSLRTSEDEEAVVRGLFGVLEEGERVRTNVRREPWQLVSEPYIDEPLGS